MMLAALAHPYSLYGLSPTITAGFVVGSALHVCLCFVLLGVSASDFLCANVAHITAMHRSSEPAGARAKASTLAAILLSWCNSAPDLFSNLLSWTSGGPSTSAGTDSAAEMSVGEVLGACGILLCIVQGALFICMSTSGLSINRVHQQSLTRDLAFTLLASMLLLYVAIVNTVSVANCTLMLCCYAGYLYVKLAGRDSRSSTIATDSRADYTTNWDTDDLFDYSRIIKPNIISALDMDAMVGLLENSEDSSLELDSMQASVYMDVTSITRPISEPVLYQNNASLRDQGPNSSPMTFSNYHDDLDEFNSDPTSTTGFRKRSNNRLWHKIMGAFAPHLMNFKQKSVVDAIVSVISSPFVALLRISCPTPNDLLDYNPELRRFEYSNIHLVGTIGQAMICPLISLYSIEILAERSFSTILWIFPALGSVAFAYTIINLYYMLKNFNRFTLTRSASTDMENDIKRKHIVGVGERIKNTFLAIGIFNTILFISVIANALIELLEIYQEVTGVSKAILGLTLFSWGNSICDLLSNIAMCRLYQRIPQSDNLDDSEHTAARFFVISCSSCIGSVMLNSMIGIGLSGLISMLITRKGSDDWWFLRYVRLQDNKGHNAKFIVSSVTILSQIVVLATVFNSSKTLNTWGPKKLRILGLAMCSLWGVATAINILLELFD